MMKGMWRWAALLSLAIGWALPMQACDVCGFSLGLNPNYNRNQLGFRYRYRSYLGSHSHGETEAGHTHVGMDKEVSQVGELFARYYPNPRWQLLAVVPATYNRGLNHGVLAKEVLGLSDPTVAAYRQLWQHVPEAEGWSDRFFAGLGVGIPLGRKLVEAGQFDAQFSPGSGAWALQAGAMWIASRGRVTVGVDGLSRYGFENAYDYQLGWRNTLNATAFYRLDLAQSKVSLLPNLGGALEWAGYDQMGAGINEDSGGLAVLASAGAECYWGRFSLTTQAQLPMLQDLNGHQARQGLRLNGGVFWSF